MNDHEPNHLARALALEAETADQLVQAAVLLLRLQAAAQPDNAGSLRVALYDSAEIELQVRVGPHPSVRLVTIDAAGGESVLLRRLELAPLPGTAH